LFDLGYSADSYSDFFSEKVTFLLEDFYGVYYYFFLSMFSTLLFSLPVLFSIFSAVPFEVLVFLDDFDSS
jgi:hypothetical protein